MPSPPFWLGVSGVEGSLADLAKEDRRKVESRAAAAIGKMTFSEFTLLQSAGIIGGLLFTAVWFRKDSGMRSVC